MTAVGVVAASLGSTGFFALATALKHRSAGQMPHMQHGGLAQLRRFIAATASHPLWLGGLLADVGGLALQVYALHIGALVVVQTLLVSSVLFSLLASHWIAGTRVSLTEVLLGGLLFASVAGFLLVSGAAEAGAVRHAADRAPAFLAGSVAVLVAGGCILASRRVGAGTAAALLGVAVGTTYASTAALIKACTNVLDHGPLALLGAWQLYALIVAGAIGLLLAQIAFSAGPLRASLPATATTDPLLSVVLGVAVYDEHLRGSIHAIALEAVCLLLMSVAVVRLSWVRAQSEDPAEHAADEHRAAD